MVGNFHLLPLAHVPQQHYPPLGATAPISDTATINHADRGQSLEPPHPPSGKDAFRTARAAAGSDQACKNEYGGDDVVGRSPPLQPSSRGCFVSGVVAGMLLGVVSAWLVVAKVLGRDTWGRIRNWFCGAERGRAGRRETTAGTPGEEKVSAGNMTSGQQGAMHVSVSKRRRLYWCSRLVSVRQR